MPVERRQLMLGAAVVAVMGLAAWTFWPSSAAPSGPAQRPVRARSGTPSTDAASGGPVDPVKLQALTTSREGPGAAARNPFHFQARVVAPPPRPIESVVTEPSRPITPTMPPGPPPLPPIGLKLIGLLERANGVRWAVLSDGKAAPMYGKDGDIIDGKYVIVKVGVESVEMTYTDGRGRQVISLTGQ